MAGEAVNQLPAVCVPNLDGAIETGRGNPGAVGAERHAVNLPGVAGQSSQLLAAGRIPNVHCSVPTGGGEPGSIGAERDLRDETAMAQERKERALGGGQVPNPNGSVMA